MARIRGIKLRKEICDGLKTMYQEGYGKSKRTLKAEGKPTNALIFSHDTYQTYLKQTNLYIDYCYERGVKGRTEAVEGIREYLIKGYEEGRFSPSTVKTKANALCKAFQIPLESLGELPKRHRADTVRSRGAAERDRHFSPKKHAFEIEFCSSFGPRANKEFFQIRGKDFEIEENGNIRLHIRNGKGGKERWVDLYTEDKAFKRELIHRIEVAGDSLMFSPKGLSNMDVHSYRAIFARRVYQAHARDLAILPKAEIYACRADRKGVHFDKKAMKIASQQLGHERLNVIAQSYLF